ncbi:MAG: amidohydrolase family protein [Acidobacteria bacterium]|nr:amidohydrolase family protein [Acidobacteriota bacterium]
MRVKPWFGCALVSLSMSSWLSAQAASSVPEELIKYPELIVYNAKIVTMDDRLVNENPGTVVEAMAVREGKIFALGDSQSILRYAGPQTQKLDLKQRTVIPGIINSHVHIHNDALSKWFDANPQRTRDAVGIFQVQGSTSEELVRQVERVLKERVSNLEPKKWAFLNLPTERGGTGRGIGTRTLQDRKIIAKQLDEWAPNHPVMVIAHPSYILNNQARRVLEEIYGIAPSMDEVPEDGFSGMGAEYRRSVIVDGYFNDHLDVLAEEIILEGLKDAAARGITTFSSHIMGINNFNAYIRLIRKYGRLPIRFGYSNYAGFQPNPSYAPGFYLRLGDQAGFGHEYFWMTGVGVSNLDGGPPMFCSSVALQADEKKREWCRIEPGSDFYKAVYQLILDGQRVNVGHNYGDKSLDIFMDMLEKAMAEKPSFTLEYIRSRQFTADHCGLYPRPDQLPRIQKLGIMLSCGANSMDRTFPNLGMYGMEKAEWISPINNILKAGVPVSFETESSLDNGLFNTFLPFITRKSTTGGYVVAPDQAVPRVIVMKMATSWGAKFLMKEDSLGVLQKGYNADFLVLNQDYFSVPLEELGKTIPLATVVGGEIVFLRESLAKELGVPTVGKEVIYGFERKDSTSAGRAME